jgi:hypothetical protein
MGRGRAKAKQTKVARELKYSSGNTDLGALQAELAGGGYHPPAPVPVVDDDEDDLYSKYIDEDDADDE